MTFKASVVACAALVFALACSTAAQPARQPGPGDVVATVDGRSITLAEVDERALSQSAGNFSSLRLADALYEARRATIDDMINLTLVDRQAQSLGIDAAELLKREVTGKAVEPTEFDVAAWYKANPNRVQNQPIEKVGDAIKNLLRGERVEALRQQYLNGLRAKAEISVRLDPPRAKVDAARRPARGPASAAVEIIEFSDFECPFCLNAFPTITKVLETYGDQVRFVYRHYPLPNHPNAKPAAEASACAAEQDKFWPYHDRLFSAAGRLSATDLKQHAVDLGLDTAAFNACVDSHKYAADVTADLAAGNAVGVNGTPAFFINGRTVSGAQPFHVFKRIIDEELARR
jgi:protein-disulfide isomerase